MRSFQRLRRGSIFWSEQSSHYLQRERTGSVESGQADVEDVPATQAPALEREKCVESTFPVWPGIRVVTGYRPTQNQAVVLSLNTRYAGEPWSSLIPFGDDLERTGLRVVTAEQALADSQIAVVRLLVLVVEVAPVAAPMAMQEPGDVLWVKFQRGHTGGQVDVPQGEKRFQYAKALAILLDGPAMNVVD